MASVQTVNNRPSNLGWEITKAAVMVVGAFGGTVVVMMGLGKLIEGYFIIRH